MKYWQCPEERPPQRFYVAFCLLASAIQDFLLGLMERENHNLNWSVTCSYYSLVHAARLITFMALGDFPTSHPTLRTLFSLEQNGGHDLTARQEGYPFDWLRGFVRVYQPERSENRPRGGTAGPRRFRPVILDYLEEVGVGNASNKLERFGRILAAAAPLRNDSNYEALLIAHEYEHIAMTSAFARLADQMSRAADLCIPFAVEAFNHFFQHDPDLPWDRRPYESLLYDYRQVRILQAVGQKLRGSIKLEQKLSQVAGVIDARKIDANHEQLERWISMGIFGPKERRMRDFESKIERLDRITTTFSQEGT